MKVSRVYEIGLQTRPVAMTFLHALFLMFPYSNIEKKKARLVERNVDGVLIWFQKIGANLNEPVPESYSETKNNQIFTILLLLLLLAIKWALSSSVIFKENDR